MVVGICNIKLEIYGANSLKSKRSVLKSIIRRLQNKFNISISEVANNDIWNRADIGLSVVSNDNKIVEETIAKVIDFIDEDDRVEILDTYYEIL